jgi:dienelactone hydrolase
MVPLLRAMSGLVLLLVLCHLPAAASVPLTEGGRSARETAAFADAGPYATEMRDVVVRRPGVQGGEFRASLAVPLPAADVPAPGCDVLSPVVAFGHGYLAPVELYEGTLRHLASWGITTIAPRSGEGLFPSHERFAGDLVAALDWVVAAAAGDDWPGLTVDPAARGVSGHSMGGGAAVLAAARDPRIRAVATLAAAETRPSAIEAAARSPAAALFLAGSDDTITPVDEHQRPMFEATTNGPARLGTIRGASHCGFLDTLPAILGLVCDEGTLEPEEQLRITRDILTAWLLRELAGDGTGADIAPLAGPDGAPLVVWE